ncbi:hypothetical protein ASPCAL12232 [Aspergillus calidoustus]|uniref:Uncharacterized protein n=1 Tax=Aspergillus calidoustus TaxID=454130 RepID=A0A0U5G9W4_ASPCI|nr:hypothetical protein ASPCAL12232 [Aspergillus calidoustus]
MPTTLIALPLLALVSIPLALIASFTIFLSTVTLYIQFSIICFKLCSALLTNLFTIPQSTSWSLLSFTVSEPTTPARRRSSDYGVFHGPLLSQQIRAQGQKQSHPSLPRLGSSNPSESPESQESPLQLHSFDSRFTLRPNLRKGPPYTQTSGFLGLTNGDEDRDFEGLGGWRCPLSSTRSPGYRSGRTTPSSTHSASDEADETAWLSINSRLELPSQPLTLRHGSSNVNDTQAETTTPTSTSDTHLPRRKNSRVTIFETKDRKRTKSQGQNLAQGHGSHRHHRRSATTSMLAGYTSTPRSPSLQPPRRHDPSWDQTSTSQGQGISMRSQSHTSLCEHWARHAVPLTSTLNSGLKNGNGNTGYFALQPQGDSGSNNGARTTSNTTPNEERKPARVVAAGLGAMSQFIPSLGGR